jgi:hypothetical protein
VTQVVVPGAKNINSVITDSGSAATAPVAMDWRQFTRVTPPRSFFDVYGALVLGGEQRVWQGMAMAFLHERQ